MIKHIRRSNERTALDGGIASLSRIWRAWPATSEYEC